MVSAHPPRLTSYRPGTNVNQEEIQQILADQGYSAGEWGSWLKTLLTDICRAESLTPPETKAALIETVKELLKRNQTGKPMSDDVL